jgi:hypothetical protein
MTPTLPQVEPITGIPITYDSSVQTGGRFTPPTIIDKVLSYLPFLNHSDKGTIRVNPANVNDPNIAIRHEAIHAILNKLNQSGQLDQLNSSNPAYGEITKKWPAFAGEPNQEFPAYIGTGESSGLNIPENLRKAGIDKLVQQLMSLDPSTAATYKKLAGIQ